jgi:hypothetical protein
MVRARSIRRKKSNMRFANLHLARKQSNPIAVTEVGLLYTTPAKPYLKGNILL